MSKAIEAKLFTDELTLAIWLPRTCSSHLAGGSTERAVLLVLKSGLNHNPDADWRWPWLWWEEGTKKDGAFVSQEEKGQADWVRSPVPFGN